MVYPKLVGIFWLVFIVYWIIASFRVKKDVDSGSMWGRLLIGRLVMAAAIILLLQSPYFKNIRNPGFNPAWSLIGLVLCGLGIGFAIWARVYLGKNWSPSPNKKENHELVTSGPYAYVRHPIYTGMILALLGSALVIGNVWIILFVVLGTILVLRIKTEEKYMTELFPNQYPQYKARTKALIPFIW